MVLPRPMSSARQPPSPSEVILAQPAQPLQLVVAQGAPPGPAGAAMSSGSASRSRSSRSQPLGSTGTCSPSTSTVPVSAAPRASRPVSGFELALAGLAGDVGVDEHPLVAQPHDRAVRLGEPVHLGGGQPLAAERDLPVEAGQVARRRGTTAGRTAPRSRSPTTAAGAQALDQRSGPVHLDPGRGQPVGGPREQVLDVGVGQHELVRHGAVQQPVQPRPGAGGAADGDASRRSWPGRRSPGSRPSHRSAASTTSDGSARLCSCTHRAELGAAPDRRPPAAATAARRSRAPADTSAAHCAQPGHLDGPGGGERAWSPVARTAPGERGIASATASRNARTRPSASARRRSASTGTARAAAGMASASSRIRRASASSNGPARQES